MQSNCMHHSFTDAASHDALEDRASIFKATRHRSEHVAHETQHRFLLKPSEQTAWQIKYIPQPSWNWSPSRKMCASTPVQRSRNKVTKSCSHCSPGLKNAMEPNLIELHDPWMLLGFPQQDPGFPTRTIFCSHDRWHSFHLSVLCKVFFNGFFYYPSSFNPFFQQLFFVPLHLQRLNYASTCISSKLYLTPQLLCLLPWKKRVRQISLSRSFASLCRG